MVEHGGDGISLREYVERLIQLHDVRYAQRFDAQEKAVLAALAAAKEAVIKAEAAYEKRFESVNEFRKLVEDQQVRFMAKGEAMQRLDALEKQIEGLIAERAGIKGGWGYAVGVLGAIAVIIGIGMSLVSFWSKVRP